MTFLIFLGVLCFLLGCVVLYQQTPHAESKRVRWERHFLEDDPPPEPESFLTLNLTNRISQQRTRNGVTLRYGGDRVPDDRGA